MWRRRRKTWLNMQSRKDGRRRDEKEYQESDRNIYFDWTVPTVVYSQIRRLISMLTFTEGDRDGEISNTEQGRKPVL